MMTNTDHRTALAELRAEAIAAAETELKASGRSMGIAQRRDRALTGSRDPVLDQLIHELHMALNTSMNEGFTAPTPARISIIRAAIEDAESLRHQAVPIAALDERLHEIRGRARLAA